MDNTDLFSTPGTGRYSASLQKALDTLNEFQRSAVEQTEGPVMVIAGPGTGKTQILAARIGHILQGGKVGDVNPGNILCLTYTEAGTVAMRERLLEFIGPDAYKVGIYTFHAFCNRVIQDHPHRFGLRELEPLSELEERQFIRETIENFSANHPLKRYGSGAYFEVSRLREFFATMKKEDWTPEYLAERAQAWLDSIPDNPDFQYQRSYKGFKKGDLKQGKVEKENKRMREMVAAANEFEPFQQKLAHHGRYDFNDMIRWVLRVFKEDEELLRDYQEQYQYFLVDEYQDTNGSQNEILQMLVDYWDQPNVFVVGDDDQSIFRFQGANVANITNFADNYKTRGLKVIVLQNNYRSSQAILDSASHLIGRNEERLVSNLAKVHEGFTEEILQKKLVASHPDISQIEAAPKVVSWQNVASETVGVAKEIERLIREEDVKPSEIAVIYRNHSQAEDIGRYLESGGIALNVKRRVDILNSRFIDHLLIILEFLEREHNEPGTGDHLVFEILHFGFFGIKPETIAVLASDLRKLLLKRNERPTWRSHIRDLRKYWRQDLFDQDRNPDLEKVYALSCKLENWLEELSDITLQQLVERIVVEGGALAWAMNQDDRTGLLQEAGTFFSFIKQETSKKPRMRLREFMESVHLLKEEGIALPLEKVVYAEDGVHFLTAHGSKGLEFEYVFMIGCTKKPWDDKRGSRSFVVPENVNRGTEGDETEESRRLFYVAMTRAKKYLQINYPQSSNTGQVKEKSCFVAEVEDSAIVQKEAMVLESPAYLNYWERFISPVGKPDIKLLEKEKIRQILKNFQLSVTNLNKYLKCPLTFYFETVLRIPTAKVPALAFGSAVHKALEKLFRAMAEDPEKKFPPLDKAIWWFDCDMERMRDSFTDPEFENRSEYGRLKVLPGYYKTLPDRWPTVITVERDLTNVVFADVPLRGKLDRIDFDGNDATVIDYKTGQLHKAKSTRKSFNPPKPDATEDSSFVERYGGNYWRQAVFYKILVDNDNRKNWRATSTRFEFVEPQDKDGEPKVEKVVVTAEDVAIVGAQIQQAWRGIQALEFERGCGEEDCRWCSFARDQYEVLKPESEAVSEEN